MTSAYSRGARAPIKKKKNGFIFSMDQFGESLSVCSSAAVNGESSLFSAIFTHIAHPLHTFFCLIVCLSVVSLLSSSWAYEIAGIAIKESARANETVKAGTVVANLKINRGSMSSIRLMSIC